MSTRPKSIKHPGLTRRQADFAREFVLNGGKRAAAARAAGYSEVGVRVEANRLLRLPAVLDAVRKESEGALHASVALGQAVLAELAEHAESETVRLAAAQALLDRGGLQLVKRSEQVITVTDNRTDAELLAHARRLASSLGMSSAITLDGDALVRTVAPALAAPMETLPLADSQMDPRGADFAPSVSSRWTQQSAANFSDGSENSSFLEVSGK